MRTISEIAEMKLPLEVLIDLDKRITDWFASGGKEEDSYIQRQIAYADKVRISMLN